jgi:hypothetical protein
MKLAHGPVLIAACGMASLALSPVVSADVVFMKGGGEVSGRVVSRTATTVEVDIGAGRIGVPTSSVLRIEEGRSPLHEYDDRAGRLAPGDVEGWVALAQWASAAGLGTQARQAWQRALSASPADPRANEALGNVQVGGRWVSEDEGYRAKGFVQFEGEWMTPAEQQAILGDRAAEADERRRQQADARQREAQEAEARARQAEADAAAAQQSEGLPLWYGWGAGPTVWPTGPMVMPPISRPGRPIGVRK